MSEQDVFETRFAAAYRRYLDEAPTEVDPAAVARAAASAHPRAGIVGWPMALRPARAFAWLIVLAILLVALGVGALLMGSERPALGFVCPPGSTPDTPGPVDQARPPHGVQAAIAFDRRAGRLVTLSDTETWTFDVCTNTWTQQHPDRAPDRVDEWDLFVYDIDSDLTISVDRSTGSTWAYDLPADTWIQKGRGPVDARLGAYDPRSGLVVAGANADPIALWTYDVETDAWTPLRLAAEAQVGVSNGALAYDASVDRIIVYTGEVYTDELRDSPQTWLLDIRAGTWSRSDAETPKVVGWWTAPTMAYDEAAKRTAVFNRDPLTAYDATADRWQILAEADATGPYPGSMAYDSLNRRLIGMSQWLGTPDVDIVPGGVEALDLVSGERTVLLEPGDG
jgi:hypothetical protein